MPEKLDAIRVEQKHLKPMGKKPFYTECEKMIIAWSIFWEGSIDIQKGDDGYFRPILEITNTDFEGLENFILRGYSPSFTHMYSELGQKLKSKREKEHIEREIQNIEREYRKIRDAEGLNRKETFQEMVKHFKRVIEHATEIAKDVVKLVEEKTSDSKLSEELINNYKFTAREFNVFIRSFRNFLDRTHCYHNIEIEHYRLMNLLIPEEMLSKVI